MSPNFEEKRNFIRVTVNCEIRIAKTAENTGKSSYVTSRVRDLSAEGVGFELREKLDPGEFLDLKLKFDSKPPVLKLKGEVMRCVPIQGSGLGHQFYIGVKFLHASKDLIPIFLKFI